MSSSSTLPNKYFNRLQANRLQALNSKINDNLLNISNKNISLDDLINDFSRDELILVSQICLNKIKKLYSKSNQFSNFDKILLYDNEILLPTYRNIVNLYVNDIKKINDYVYTIDIDKNSIKSITHNDFIENGLILSTQVNYDSEKDESKKDFHNFCVNSGLNGPGVIEIYTNNKAYTAVVKKFNSYDNIEFSFIDTHKNINQANIYYNNKDINIDTSDFINKNIHLSIPKSIYNKALLLLLLVAFVIAAPLLNLIPGLGEIADAGEADFIAAECTETAVTDVATSTSVSSDAASSIGDEVVTTFSTDSAADLSSGEISADIDSEVDTLFSDFSKSFGTELKKALEKEAKVQIKKFLKNKLKIVFKKAILKTAQMQLNAIIFHSIEIAYAITVVGMSQEEIDNNQRWTDKLPTWLTSQSSVQFIKIESNSQAKDIKIAVNKRAVKKCLLNTAKVIGKEKAGEIFDNITDSTASKYNISNPVSIQQQDNNLTEPLKSETLLTGDNILRIKNNVERNVNIKVVKKGGNNETFIMIYDNMSTDNGTAALTGKNLSNSQTIFITYTDQDKFTILEFINIFEIINVPCDLYIN